MVIGSVKPSLQYSPHALDPIGVRHTIDKLLGAMVHTLMIQPYNLSISCVFIGVEIRPRGYLAFDVALDGVGVNILDDHGSSSPTAFTYPKYWSLVDRPTA